MLSDLRQGSNAESKHDDHFAFGVEVISTAAFAMSQTQTQAVTMLDGGSTRHVTDEATDCIDVKPCNINVKVGGGTLTCSQQGTRVYHYLKDGVPTTCLLLDTLIIPGFGLKIVSEAPFLLSGCSIKKCQGVATISTKTGIKVIDCPINQRGLAFMPPLLTSKNRYGKEDYSVPSASMIHLQTSQNLYLIYSFRQLREHLRSTRFKRVPPPLAPLLALKPTACPCQPSSPSSLVHFLNRKPCASGTAASGTAILTMWPSSSVWLAFLSRVPSLHLGARPASRARALATL